MKSKVTNRMYRDMVDLRKRGFSYRFIAQYISEDYNIYICHSTVRYALNWKHRKNERKRANVNYFRKKGGNTLDVEPAIFY